MKLIEKLATKYDAEMCMGDHGSPGYGKAFEAGFRKATEIAEFIVSINSTAKLFNGRTIREAQKIIANSIKAIPEQEEP